MRLGERVGVSLPEDVSLTFQWRTLTPSCHSSSNVWIILCRSFCLSFGTPFFVLSFHICIPFLSFILSLMFLLRKKCNQNIYICKIMSKISLWTLINISHQILPRFILSHPHSVYLYVNNHLFILHSYITEQITWSRRNLMRNVWVYIEIFDLGYRKYECSLRLQHKFPLTLHCCICFLKLL